MWSLICLQLLVAAAGQVHGMEFSLYAVRDGDLCGMVECRGYASPYDPIKRLTIRKQLNTDFVLVEMSQQQPSFTSTKNDRTKNNFWAKGTLSSRTTEAEIRLYNSEDCNNAVFICEVVQMNKHGVERVRSSSGRINGKLGPQIQDLPSSLADFESKIDSKIQGLSSSVSKILSKLDALTDTINEVKTKQHLTTCPTSASASPDKRYQVVYPTDGTSYLCDTDGGWTVIQRRVDGKTDFYRNWYNYTHGFGTFDGDFWLGLKRIHQISSSSSHELNITMEYEGKLYYAHYDNFVVSGEEDNYRLSIGAYMGTAGDELSYNNNKRFSTYDKDNDTNKANCADKRYRYGAWWYGSCSNSNLNGKWGAERYKGLQWFDLTKSHSATMTEMKIRKMI